LPGGCIARDMHVLLCAPARARRKEINRKSGRREFAEHWWMAAPGSAMAAR
jgi:hypothetical protein